MNGEPMNKSSLLLLLCVILTLSTADALAFKWKKGSRATAPKPLNQIGPQNRIGPKNQPRQIGPQNRIGPQNKVYGFLPKTPQRYQTASSARYQRLPLKPSAYGKPPQTSAYTPTPTGYARLPKRTQNSGVYNAPPPGGQLARGNYHRPVPSAGYQQLKLGPTPKITFLPQRPPVPSTTRGSVPGATPSPKPAAVFSKVSTFGTASGPPKKR